MKFKKSIILVVLVIFIFGVASVCASEDTGQMVLSASNGMVKDTLQISEENTTLTQENNYECLGEKTSSYVLDAGEEGNYSDLRKDIENGGILTKSYYSYFDGDGETIEITTPSMVIEGNGAVIDMVGSTDMRAFYVSASDVTFKNLTIKNAKFSENGGAIYFNGSGTVENCNFINNIVYGDGGAIYFNANSTGKIVGCNFTNNKIPKYLSLYGSGGAVYFALDTNANVTNCNFDGNYAYGSGSAIYMFSGTVMYCNFTRNKVDGWGTIHIYSGTVRYCNFINCNSIEGCGGAIAGGTYDKNVTDCNFINCTSVYSGGAIHFNNAKHYVVKNCNFINCSSRYGGGAVQINGGEAYLINCNFYGNNAPMGSAIQFSQYSSTDVTIINTIFLNNKANVDANTPLNVTKNGNHIEIIFRGNNDLLNAIQSSFFHSSIHISFNNVTYWGANGITNTGNSTFTSSNREAGQNISVRGVVDGKIINTTKVTDENGTIVLGDVGEYWLTVRHDEDSYYTKAAEKLFTNMKLNVNVTSVLSNNRRVNITAKSNIYGEVMQGRLIFILPDGTKIDANYASGGIWWAEYAFDDYGVYQVNASYVGLENVTISNGTITIKPDSTIILYNIILDYGQSYDLTVKTIGATGITAKIDKNDVCVNNFTISISSLGAGNHTLTVTTIPDRNHNSVNNTVKITVNKASAEIILNNETLDLKAKDSVSDFAQLTPGDVDTLTYSSSNNDVARIEDGMIVAVGAGKANIKVSFKGNENYTASEDKTISVTVTPINASVSVNKTEYVLYIDDEVDILVNTVPDGLTVDYANGGTVISVDDKGHIKALSEGNTTILVSIGDNVVYTYDVVYVTVIVKKIDTSIGVDLKFLDLEVGENSNISATLTPPDAGNVTFISTNSSVVVVDAEGNVKAVGSGNASIIVSYVGNDKYNAAENRTVAVTVNGIYIIVSAQDVTKYFNGNERFVVIVKDYLDNSLANQSVSISVGGVNYTRITDVNGTATIAIDLVSGQYDVTTVACNKTVYSTITVLPTVNAVDLIKVFRNGTQFYAAFKDSNGNYLADGSMVRFNINGVMYDRKVSGDNGLAKLNINLEQGQYVITSMNLETGENAANNITVISRIIENNDLTKYYRNASQYAVKVIGDDGNPVGAGKTVTFNVYGILYNRTTNESGIAKLNINMHQGDYVITAEYDGCRVSNNIKVLPVLSAGDLTKKYGTNDQFTATLVDGRGIALAGETVQFNVNGVFYNRVTDSNGQAKLNIRLMPGKYIITSSYNGTSIANNITVSV